MAHVAPHIRLMPEHPIQRLIFWTVFVAVLVAVLWAVVRYVSPMPPRTLVMSTGIADGAYHHFGQRYREILKANGIALELRTSSGSIENLARLNDGSVSVAFIQGGTGGQLATDAETLSQSTPLRSLATIAYEPVWIFTQTLEVSEGLGVLAERRIAVGVPGSGNEMVAMQLLAAYGITADPQSSATSTLVRGGGMAVVEMLRRREIDAAIIVAASAAPAVQRLLSDESMHLASLDHVEGLARRFGYFQPVSLKRGSVDAQHDLPHRDINLLATTANLVVRDELHPALAYLLLEAAQQVHQGPSLIHAAGEFPSPKATEFPLAPAAERYFRDGRPFLLNYLPFWVANLVQRLVFLLLPLAAILIPLVRLLPEFISRRQTSGLYRRYGELNFLEKDLTSRRLNDEERHRARGQLDRIENELVQARFPLALSDRLYTLRQHVDFVRAQLDRQTAK
jgi:TRAP transporter TAXI family solute receptor